MRMTCACICVMYVYIYSLYTELTLSFREIRVSYLCLTLLLVGRGAGPREGEGGHT